MNAQTSPGPSKTLTESTESGRSNRSNSQLTGSEEPLVKPRRGSGRGSDPLPGLPTLETADNMHASTSAKAKEGEREGEEGKEKEEEEDGRYASVEKKDKENRAYDYVENVEEEQSEDKAGYAYARVRGAAGMAEVRARSESERKGEGSPLPPYGKVTRHLVPASSVHGRYSEVRSTSSPALPPGRLRSHTDPIEPAEGRGLGVRDERALTESAAHLPLPQIPKLEVNDDMYDSIPDEMKAKPVAAPISLYESVDVVREVVKEDEDMYESVPEDIRQATSSSASSPPLSPSSPASLPPAPLPPRSPSQLHGNLVESPVPPSSPKSPLAKRTETKDVGKKEDEVKKRHKGFFKEKKDDEGKQHKALAKTVSDSSTEHRGRSLSSIFHRKKPGTVIGSSSVSKLKKEKDPHEPLPTVPTGAASPSQLSSPHLHPPHIPVPLPPDDEDDVGSSPYDMPDVLNPRAATILKANAAEGRGKSASLPASMRSAGSLVYNPKAHHGPLPDVPLPDVPEESAGGVVSRLRRKESLDPNYDTVVLEQVHDDPNYDSVEYNMEEREVVESRGPKLQPAKPEDGERRQERKEDTPTRYAKVIKHSASATVGVPASQQPDEGAYSPEHDEMGYAMIPAHLKMRKRTKSEAMRTRQQEWQKNRPKSADTAEKNDSLVPSTAEQPTGPDLMQNPDEPQYEAVSDELKQTISPTSPHPPASCQAEGTGVAETEDPYSTVDIAAKRQSQILRQQSSETSEVRDKYLDEMSASPNPPPLPQQGDLGDLSEFNQPPIPVQMEGVLQLVEPPYARVLEHPGSGPVPNPYTQIDVAADPPYASINKNPGGGKGGNNLEVKPGGENDPPYATVKKLQAEAGGGGGGGGHAPNDPPYARINKGWVEGEEGSEDPGYETTGTKLQSSGPDAELEAMMDEAYGYDTVGIGASSQKQTSGPDAESEAMVDEAYGYDTVRIGASSQKQTSARGVVNGEQVGEGQHLEGGVEEDGDAYNRLDHGQGKKGPCGTKRHAVANAGGEEVVTVTVDFRGSPASPVTVTNTVGEATNGGPVLEQDAEVKTISFAD